MAGTRKHGRSYCLLTQCFCKSFINIRLFGQLLQLLNSFLRECHNAEIIWREKHTNNLQIYTQIFNLENIRAENLVYVLTNATENLQENQPLLHTSFVNSLQILLAWICIHVRGSIGWFQKISIPYHGRHLHLDPPLALGNSKMLNPPLPSEFQTVLPPPCLRNSAIIQMPLRNCRCFLPTDLKSPLYIPNTFIKRKLILSLPPKEKNVHSAQQTINVAWWQTAADWVIFYILTFHGKLYTTDNPLNIRKLNRFEVIPTLGLMFKRVSIIFGVGGCREFACRMQRKIN